MNHDFKFAGKGIVRTGIFSAFALAFASFFHGSADAVEPTGTARTEPVRKPFVHPGLLHTEADFERMRAKVAVKASPWMEGFQKLESSPWAQLKVKPRPVAEVFRGGEKDNCALMFKDLHCAYQLALRWKVTGDKAFADKAVEVLNAWSGTLTVLGGNSDRFLASGIYGYEWANAGEIMRTYPGWKKEEFARFQEMMLRIFYPMNQSFLFGGDGGKGHNGAAITNYWANWDLCNIASMQAIGVLCDRRDVYDAAMGYLKTGAGNGALHKAVYYLHDGPLGQWQEAGRDQGHATLGIALMGPIMETAWNQGEDWYGAENNRFLAGAEYIAKSNLGKPVPFQMYAWGTGPKGDRREQTAIAPGSIFRNGFELVVNHYVNRRGIAAPYCEQMAAKVRPEGGALGGAGGAYDQFGLGTLTATREPEVKNAAPSGLIVRRREGKPVLSWWGAAGCDSYTVKRAAAANGPFSTIGKEIKEILTYADEAAPAGACYYVVTGMREGKETGQSNVAAIMGAPALRVHLKFDETAGNTAMNAANKAAAAVLPMSGSWGAGKFGNAVALNGKDQYVELPAGIVSELVDFTIAAWVNVEAAAVWSRIFDFGDESGDWMFLTANSGKGMPRFEVTNVHGYNAQRIDGTAGLPAKRWVHVAVTLAGRTGTIYVDGVAAGGNAAIEFPPFQLGTTTRNWIGRSQYERDPYLNGKVDDFRIYDGALTPAQVAALARSSSSP